MAQPSFTGPDQLRYDNATSSRLGTDVHVSIAVPYTGSSPITVQAGNDFIVNVSKSGDNLFLIQ